MSRPMHVVRHRVSVHATCSAGPAPPPPKNWRQRAKPIPPGSPYPAKDHCSRCGLCDTYYVAHVKEACAFLGDGMGAIHDLEKEVHGRARDLTDTQEQGMGVTTEVLYARVKPPVPGAQWTGVVTQIAVQALETGLVEAVVCVQSEPGDHLAPLPVVARSVADIVAARGVKPSLSPNLNTLALVESLGIKRLLFIGVGCQVQALRHVEKHLGLEALYVLGTNCVDNGRREGLAKFLQAASDSPDTVLHYEFMQDYRVHLKHRDGHFEKVPYFSLPANDLNDVIAPSCYACFDYANAAADVVVGYMGVPSLGVDMTQHLQYVTVRNERGAALLKLIEERVERRPPVSAGDRKALVLQTVLADDEAKLGKGPKPMPRLLGTALAWLLTRLGPRGMEFARYSLDYHVIRNYLHVVRTWGKERAARHVPAYAKQIVADYDAKGAISARLALTDATSSKRAAESS
uniref:7-hydroxymethyl chlorophyll a reductase, chloroplastic n=1 Tax=Auxenochlorella protothecoides TaxID=3075 RepID=A0A1D2AAC4_AUXPR